DNMGKPISLKSSALLMFFLCLFGSAALSESQTQATKPRFDVVSIRPGKAPGVGAGIRMQANGGRLIANNVTVKMVVRRAYSSDSTGLFPNQMIGGPGRIETALT